MFFRWCHHCCCSKMARSCGYVFNVVKRGIWNPKHYLFFLPLKRKSQKARLWLMLTMSATNAGVTTGKTQIRNYSTTKNDCDDMQWIWLVGSDQSLWWKAVRQSQSAISQFVLEGVQVGNYRNYTVKVLLLLFHNQKTNSCNTFFWVSYRKRCIMSKLCSLAQTLIDCSGMAVCLRLIAVDLNRNCAEKGSLCKHLAIKSGCCYSPMALEEVGRPSCKEIQGCRSS